jgi:hypothetical protein
MYVVNDFIRKVNKSIKEKKKERKERHYDINGQEQRAMFLKKQSEIR